MAEFKKPETHVCYPCIIGKHDECDDHRCACEICQADDNPSIFEESDVSMWEYP